MQTPIGTSDAEMELMSRLWAPQLKDDLYQYVMFKYPWGEKGTPLENFQGPRKWQKDVLDTVTKHIRDNQGRVDFEVLRCAVASGRGIGKSALVSWLVGWMLDTRIGSTTIVSANSESQLRSVTWAEITKWVSMSLNSHWYEISATRITPAKWLTDLVERDLKKGTRYWICEGRLWSEENPDAYAGLHNFDGVLLIFDEGSGIPAPIWSVADGFFTENTPNRFRFAFSNPRRNSGTFYECFNAKRKYWDTRNIDARTVEGTDKAVYQQIIDEYGPESYEAYVEVYGEFPNESEDQFIPSPWVNEAMARALHNDMNDEVMMGVDPARHGADSTVIAIRRGRDLLELLSYQGDDAVDVEAHIVAAMAQYKPIIVNIDADGVGGPIYDHLHRRGFKQVRPIYSGRTSIKPAVYANKRAEMWAEMKQWLREASIPNDKRLKSDLITPLRKTTNKGQILIEAKKDIKSRGYPSPDRADALMYSLMNSGAQKQNVDRKKGRNYNGQRHDNLSWMGS